MIIDIPKSLTKGMVMNWKRGEAPATANKMLMQWWVCVKL
jgi:hypothetical protein